MIESCCCQAGDGTCTDCLTGSHGMCQQKRIFAEHASTPSEREWMDKAVLLFDELFDPGHGDVE